MGMGHQTGFDANAFGPFGALFQSYFSALDRFGEGKGAFETPAVATQASAALKVATRCQLEMMGLANRRVQAYLQVPTRLAHCRTPQDVLDAQMAFWRTAADQYGETYRKVFDAWASADPWSLSNGRSAAARDYINFNGTGGKENGAHAPLPEQSAGKQRRVA